MIRCDVRALTLFLLRAVMEKDVNLCIAKKYVPNFGNIHFEPKMKILRYIKSKYVSR